MNKLQEYIFYSKYSRFDHKTGRRETLQEAINRYFDYMIGRFPAQKKTIVGLKPLVEKLEVMPSMRALSAAGPALDKDDCTAYNCAGKALYSYEVIPEILYLSLCGVGVGTSVEHQYINFFPPVPHEINKQIRPIIVEDSREGWAKALSEFLECVFVYRELRPIDISQLRPKGSPLFTTGGQAAGGEAYLRFINEVKEILLEARGRRLKTTELFRVICHMGNLVSSGGVRRVAFMVLFDKEDEEMMLVKTGEWYEEHPEYAYANISAVMRNDITRGDLDLISLFSKQYGEPGIFNPDNMGTAIVNPCGEVGLAPTGQFCNLTEVVCRPDDDLDAILDKIRVAVYLGTMQSLLTNFNKDILSKGWHDNAKNNRILGVSLTGIYDCPAVLNESAYVLGGMREYASVVHINACIEFNIDKPATRITCIKPSGTASLLAGSSSGIHQCYIKEYGIRRVWEQIGNPMDRLLTKYEIPHKKYDDTKHVFELPFRNPRIGEEVHSALKHFETYKKFANSWCDHNASITLSVKESEWKPLMDAMYESWSFTKGLTMLPEINSGHEFLPYEECSRSRYNELSALLNAVDFSWLSYYDAGVDYTIPLCGCTGDHCELI